MNREVRVVLAKTWITNLVMEFINENLQDEDDVEIKNILYSLLEKLHSLKI